MLGISHSKLSLARYNPGDSDSGTKDTCQQVLTGGVPVELDCQARLAPSEPRFCPGRRAEGERTKRAPSARRWVPWPASKLHGAEWPVLSPRWAWRWDPGSRVRSHRPRKCTGGPRGRTEAESAARWCGRSCCLLSQAPCFASPPGPGDFIFLSFISFSLELTYV